MSDANAPGPGANPLDAVPVPAPAEPVLDEAEAAQPPVPAPEPQLPPPVAGEATAPESLGLSLGRASVQPSPVDDAARRRDKTAGTVIVVVAFILGLGISLWAKHESRPEVSEPPRPPTTEGVVGFPSAVDPLATLPAARLLTKRPMLRGLVAEGVAVNGTVDLGQTGSRIRYTFQSPPGHGPQPPREPGTLSRQHYCGKQAVQVKKGGLVADADRAEASCPASHTEPLPDPQCTLKELWQAATKRGMPSDKVAKVEYYRSRSGPAWRFELPGTKHRFSLLGDCQRELTGNDALNL
jgi:hypothetical protein